MLIILLCLFFVNSINGFQQLHRTSFVSSLLYGKGKTNPTKNIDDYLHPFQNISFQTSDGINIHGWLFLQHKNGTDGMHIPTILYLHDYDEDLDRAYRMALTIYIVTHCNVFMVEYRGYGYSHGKASEKGFVLDARSGLEKLRLQYPKINPENILVYGYGLGGYVGIQLMAAESNKLAGGIIQASGYKLRHVLRQHRYIGNRIISPLAFHMLDSSKIIQKVQIPTLFIHNENDTLVHKNQIEKLYEACGSQYKSLHTIPDADHVYFLSSDIKCYLEH